MGGVPPENEQAVLTDLINVYSKMPEGPAKEAMAKAIEEQKGRAARQGQQPAPAQAPTPVPTPAPNASGIGSEFAKWKQQRQNEVPR